MTNALEEWFIVAKLPVGFDTEELSNILEEQGIVHRFVPRINEIDFEIKEPTKRTASEAILRSVVFKQPKNQLSKAGLLKLAAQYPVVICCILLSIIGMLIVRFNLEWVQALNFVDSQIVGNKIFFIPFEESLNKGEYWRLITPAILHFGVFHLVFNCLWLWELGKRIEGLAGSLHFSLVVVCTAIIANISQYQLEGPALFGGMSGVVYGLLGYVWLRNRISPHPLLRLPPGLLVIMIGWLVFCMTDILNTLIQIQVANAAHIGGLLSGMLLGIIASKLPSKPTVV